MTAKDNGKDKPQAIEPVQAELTGQDKQKLANTESTVHSVLADLNDIGDVVDYTKMTTEELGKEFRKFRLGQEQFKWEVKKLIAVEIEKQVKPLADQLAALTAKNPKTIYVKFRFTFFELFQAILKRIVDFFNWIYAKIKK